MNNKEHYLYSTWLGMRERCNNQKAESYKNYGARGIKVCTEWDNFWSFVKDMGDRPEGHTLDRKDNDKGYSKENCHWATTQEQLDNRRSYVIKGSKGYHRRPSGRYCSQIKVSNVMVQLGTFDCPLMAHLAYKDAVERKLRGEPVK